MVSTHKLISGLTQSSVLMARGERVNLARLDGMVHMTQSTSPQVLMYASIDAARQQMAVHGAELWRGAIELAEWARERIAELPGLRCLGAEVLARDGVAEFDPTRLTISACDLGLSGYQLETVLRDDYRIAVEAADPLNIVLNVTFGDSREDLELLVGALRDLAARYGDEAGGGGSAACSGLLAHTPPFTRQVLSPRDAVVRAGRRPAAGRVRRAGERRDGHAVPAGHPRARARRGDLRRRSSPTCGRPRRRRAQGARPGGPHAALAARRRLTPVPALADVPSQGAACRGRHPLQRSRRGTREDSAGTSRLRRHSCTGPGA